MCRMLAVPSNFPKKATIKILDNFISQDDGVGSVYVKDGEFIVNKWKLSYEEVMKKGLPLLNHMPHNGWTLIHLRSASEGDIKEVNTHPFIKGDWAGIHNGTWLHFEPVKAVLSLSKRFEGQTDSEVAVALWEAVGRQKFIETMNSGVFMFLNKRDQLNAVCFDGDLEFKRTRYGVVLASEFETKDRVSAVQSGVFLLNRAGGFTSAKWQKLESFSYPKYTKYELPKLSKKEEKEFEDLYEKDQGRACYWR